MKWQSIISNLCYSTIVMQKNISPDQDYIQTLLLNRPPLKPSEHILYFCNLSDYRMFHAHPSLCSYILYQDIPANEVIHEYAENNLLLFQNQEDFLRAYQTISIEISELEEMRRNVAELFILSANDTPLQTIVNRIDQLFHVCVSVLDNSFSVLAFSDYTAMPSARILLDIHSNSIPLLTQRMLNTPNFAAPHGKQTSAVYFDTKLGDGYQVRNYLTLIYMDHLKLASFSLLYTCPEDEELPTLSSDVLDLLPQVASALSLKISKKESIPRVNPPIIHIYFLVF